MCYFRRGTNTPLDSSRQRHLRFRALESEEKRHLGTVWRVFASLKEVEENIHLSVSVIKWFQFKTAKVKTSFWEMSDKGKKKWNNGET